MNLFEAALWGTLDYLDFTIKSQEDEGYVL